MSVPQNITIKYITEDLNEEENQPETLYMTQEQQDAIESLISIPQQTVTAQLQVNVKSYHSFHLPSLAC